MPTASTAPDGTVFGPGSDGIGDSYYPKAGNGGYDVGNYDLDVRYDPAAGELTGNATITATATANLTRFDLDFDGLPVTSTTVNGQAAGRQQQGGELVITPATPLPTGATFTTVVVYRGKPSSHTEPALGATGFLTTADGAVAIGEPQVAASWFPVNDHPRDKATYTIRISAPSGLAALSNGTLVSKQPAAVAGYTTWTWRESSPMAPYLATMVVGNYRVLQSTHDGRPVVLAVHSSLPASIDLELAQTPQIVDYLASVFGPYPFDALGGIVINEPRVNFALENQTRPVYAATFFADPDPSWVLAHELAHQWYGDSVSINDWSDIWLNEGFATYAEWLWNEHRGVQTAQQAFDRLYALPDDAQLWQVPPANLGLDHIFQAPGSEYARGAMTLQALRLTVGDDAFFRILRGWAAQKKDGVATTRDFIAFAEQVSGRQLDQLFQDWLYGTVRPPRP
ncbi:MAG TPA: M1 family metallopeptidase [Micromonosporaceae bacterium]